MSSVILDATKRITYFKRFQMEVALEQAPVPAQLPIGFAWIPWAEHLVETHAEVLFQCFHQQIDARVFPSLGDRHTCLTLMNEIRKRPGFLPESTWLLTTHTGYVGSIQSLHERSGVGAIQNIGVAPQMRGIGLGTALLLQALEGFRRAGLAKATLEVTAQNTGAIRLYRKLGFRHRKTLYKAVEAAAEVR